MFANLKPSEDVALLGVIDPVSQGAGTAATPWISVAAFERFLAVLQTGAMSAGATVDAKLQQAQDASGTGAVDMPLKAITQLAASAGGASKQALINLRTDELNLNAGFGYVRLVVTVGTAAALITATVFGFNPRRLPASTSNAASVAQIVG